MTANANGEASDSDDGEATMPTDPAETTDLTEDLDAGAESDEVYVLPRSTRRSGENPFNVLSGINTAELFGMQSVLTDVKQTLFPEMTSWKQKLLPGFEPMRYIVTPEIDSWKQNLMPSVTALIEDMTPAITMTNSVVKMSGITDIMESIQAQHRISLANLAPKIDIADYMMPIVHQASGMAAIQKDLLASDVIKNLVASPFMDTKSILANLSSTDVLADLFTTADFMKTIDFTSLVANGLSAPSPRSAAIRDAGRQPLDATDVDRAEEVAIHAVLEAIEDGLDLDAPPTPEQVGALQALSRLIVALRPDIREDPQVGRWLVNLTTGTTLQMLVYFAVAHPSVLAVLFLATGIADKTMWVRSKATGFLLPQGSTEDDDTDTED